VADGRLGVERAWLASLVAPAAAAEAGAPDGEELLHRWVAIIARACFRTIAPLLPREVSTPLVPLIEDVLLASSSTAERILDVSVGLSAPEIEPMDHLPSDSMQDLHHVAAVTGGTNSVQIFLRAIPKQVRLGDTGLISTALGSTAAYLIGAAVSADRLAGLDRELSLKELSTARDAIERYRRTLSPAEDETLLAGSMALHSHPRDEDTELPPVDVVKAHVVASLRLAEWLLRAPHR
jgi:hypothetical protein